MHNISRGPRTQGLHPMPLHLPGLTELISDVFAQPSGINQLQQFATVSRAVRTGEMPDWMGG